MTPLDYGALDRPGRGAVPGLLAHRHVRHGRPLHHPGVDSLQVEVEEAEVLQPLRHVAGLGRRVVRQILVGVPVPAVVPRAYHRALRVGEGQEPPDDRVGGVGVVPASPAVDRRPRTLDLLPQSVHAEVVYSHPEAGDRVVPVRDLETPAEVGIRRAVLLDRGGQERPVAIGVHRLDRVRWLAPDGVGPPVQVEQPAPLDVPLHQILQEQPPRVEDVRVDVELDELGRDGLHRRVVRRGQQLGRRAGVGDARAPDGAVGPGLGDDPVDRLPVVGDGRPRPHVGPGPEGRPRAALVRPDERVAVAREEDVLLVHGVVLLGPPVSRRVENGGKLDPGLQWSGQRHVEGDSVSLAHGDMDRLVRVALISGRRVVSVLAEDGAVLGECLRFGPGAVHLYPQSRFIIGLPSRSGTPARAETTTPPRRTPAGSRPPAASP